MIDGDIPPELSNVFNISYLFPESGIVFNQMYFPSPLPEEEGKHNQDCYEETGERTNTHQVTLDVGVVRVEFGARRLGRHAHGGRRSFGSLCHFKLLSFVIAQKRQCAVYQRDRGNTKSMSRLGCP